MLSKLWQGNHPWFSAILLILEAKPYPYGYPRSDTPVKCDWINFDFQSVKSNSFFVMFNLINTLYIEIYPIHVVVQVIFGHWGNSWSVPFVIFKIWVPVVHKYFYFNFYPQGNNLCREIHETYNTSSDWLKNSLKLKFEIVIRETNQI